MLNSLENQSFISTGLEIVLYDDQVQEAQNRRKCPNNIITAEPLTWWRPQEESGAFEGDGSSPKRKRCVSELEVENDKDFSLLELYKSNNIHEIISRRQKDETTLDPQELLKNLKGWTVEKRKREKNGKDRVDKTYRHPKSKKVLRSLVEVKKFIEESSHTEKALDSGEVGSQAAPDNMYLQIFKRREKAFGNGVRQAFNNSSNKRSISSSWSEQLEAISASKTARGTTFKSHDMVDLSLHSHRPFHYQERMNEKWNVVPQAEQKVSDSSKQQFSNLTRFGEQECLRTFGVGSPSCDVFGGSSSSSNISSLNEIKIMVQSQVEAHIEARVAAQVEERLSHYEKTQREMAQRMESMHRLLLLQGMLPPSQFLNTHRS